MKTMLLCGAVLLAALVAIPSKTQDQPAPVQGDANGYVICRDWNTSQQSAKLGYVVGYGEGLIATMSAVSEIETQGTFSERYRNLHDAMWPILYPASLSNREIIGRVDNYCAVHEPDEVTQAITSIAQQILKARP